MDKERDAAIQASTANPTQLMLSYYGAVEWPPLCAHQPHSHPPPPPFPSLFHPPNTPLTSLPLSPSPHPLKLPNHLRSTPPTRI